MQGSSNLMQALGPTIANTHATSSQGQFRTVVKRSLGNRFRVILPVSASKRVQTAATQCANRCRNAAATQP